MIPPVVTGAAVRQLADLARDFGTFSAEVTKTYLPQLRLWAAGNLYRCKDKLDQENSLRQQAGRTPIPVRFALPALAKVAEEDDDNILTLWARLFANLQDPECQIIPNRIYIHVLSEMEALDAKLLLHTVDVLSTKQTAQSAVTAKTVGIMGTTADEVAADLGVSPEQMNLSLYNLTRLGCFRSEQNNNVTYLIADTSDRGIPPASPWGHGWPWIESPEASFHLTGLGHAVVIACRGANLDQRAASPAANDG